MAGQVAKEARAYIDRAIKTQARLGYQAEVPDDVYERALADVARATDRLRRAQQRPASA